MLSRFSRLQFAVLQNSNSNAIFFLGKNECALNAAVRFARDASRENRHRVFTRAAVNQLEVVSGGSENGEVTVNSDDVDCRR